MINIDYDKFFQKKLFLLKSILGLTENFISDFENLDDPNDILNNRQDLIDELSSYESDFDDNPNEHLSEIQKSEINNTINLILQLDKDCLSLMTKKRDAIFQNLKNNLNEQNIAKNYGFNSIVSNGRFLDYKK